MDDRQIRRIQREGADALLDAGLSVPLLRIRIPFRRKPLTMRVTMRRPRLGGLILFARLYLRTGVTARRMWNFTPDEELRFIAKHGKELSLMAACTLCRSWWLQYRWPLNVAAWSVRRLMPQRYMFAAVRRFVSLTTTDPFISIIASAQRMNPMRLRASQRRKGSQGAGMKAPIAPSALSGR